MRTTRTNWQLFAAIFLGIAVPTASGCSLDWLHSPSTDYAKPGELSQDVSDLPDPNAPAPSRDKEPTFANPIAAQYGGGATMKESPKRLLLQANAYFVENRFHDSARLYQKYLATSEARTAPAETLAVAHYRIGFVARKKMNFKEAKAEFQQALQFAPKNAEYRFALGKTCYDSTDFAGADATFSTLIAENPNYPEAHYYYGLTLLEGTRRAEAVRPLTIAVGELQANALLTDKYYQIGDIALATQAETQTAQIAARLGQTTPQFPHKTASNVSQTALTTNATPTTPAVSTPNLAPVSAFQTPHIQQTSLAAQASPIAQISQTAPQQPSNRQTTPIASTAKEEPASVFASRLTPRLASAANANSSPIESTATSNELAPTPSLPPSQLLLPALKETLARSKKKDGESEISNDEINAKPIETAAFPALESFGTTAFDAINQTANEIFAESAIETTVAETAEIAPFGEESIENEAPEPAESLDAEPSLNQGFLVPEIETNAEINAESNETDAAPLDEIPNEISDELAAQPVETPNVAQDVEDLLAADVPFATSNVDLEKAQEETIASVETTETIETPSAPVQLGRRNPGLFAASDATQNSVAKAFKPGSIGDSDADETKSNATTEHAQTALISPDLQPPQLLRPLQNASTEQTIQNAPNAPNPEPARFFAADARAALACVDAFDSAEELVAEFRNDRQAASNNVFNENDDFAFAASGSSVQPVATPISAPVATPLLTPNPTSAFIASETAPVEMNTQAPAQLPAPSTVHKNATFAVQRTKSTPEERLEAARAAGAEIRELTPNQYRRAVAAGLGNETIQK